MSNIQLSLFCGNQHSYNMLTYSLKKQYSATLYSGAQTADTSSHAPLTGTGLAGSAT